MTASQPIESAKQPWTVPRQHPALSVFKLLGVVLSSVLLVSLAGRLVAALGSGALPLSKTLLALPALLLGYLLADLLSGMAHWFCDTFFAEDTPLIGKVLIQPFRDHHVHPQRITQYRFLEQDTTNFFLMLPPLALAFWLGAPRAGSLPELAWTSCLLGLAGGSFATNIFHKWAHMPEPPRAVRWLQATGLILDAERHRHHHRDYSRGFCVTSGWMNPLLDAVGFFPRVERLVRFLQR